MVLSSDYTQLVKPPIPSPVSDKYFELLWSGGSLKKRDLGLTDNEKTHSTGSMLFKKGEMKNIDQRTYFRETIFCGLPWRKNSNPNRQHLESAPLLVRLFVGSQDHGYHLLNLTHNTRKDSTSYLQRNAMTSVSWGKAKTHVCIFGNLGKSISVHRDTRNGEFVIIIMDGESYTQSVDSENVGK
jgi:hypothetical protein